MKREMYKEVEVDGRKWRIGRFDALTGSYITMLILSQMLPMGLDKQVTDGAVKGRSLMDKETFFDVQRECLKVVQELKDVGGNVAPVYAMLPDGRWGVEDLETNLTTVLSLTVSALVFNITDFFQGNTLNNLIESVSGLTQFNVQQ